MSVSTTIQLDDRHELFCQEYTQHYNATAAAKAAGFAEGSAYNQGWNLLQRMDVQLRIEELKAPRIGQLEISRESVLRAMGAIALVDRRALKNKHIDEMTEEEAACIEGFKYDKEGNLEIKVSPKMPALKGLGEHFNLFVDHQKAGSGTINVTIDGKDAQL